MSTVTTYPNPIESKTRFNVGDVFFLHANPRLPGLEEGDVVNIKLETEEEPYGKAVILPYDIAGPNTYRARRTE